MGSQGALCSCTRQWRHLVSEVLAQRMSALKGREGVTELSAVVETSLELRMTLPKTGSHELEGQPAIVLFYLQGWGWDWVEGG